MLIGIWLTCALFTAIIFANKGKSAFGGAVLGLLFGIFGLIYAIAMTPDAKGVEAQALRTGKFKRCPRCAETVNRDALVCRFCQSEFAPVPPDAGHDHPPMPNPMDY